MKSVFELSYKIKGINMKYTLLLFSLLISSVAFGGVGTGKVTGIIPYSSGTDEMFFIKLENISSTPACNGTSRFTMKSTHPAYKGTYSAVLAALMSGMTVRATGKGTCNNFSNSEDLMYICLGVTPC